MTPRIFGEISGIQPGETFANRLDVSLSGVHRPRRAGISSSQKEGADSLVISGKYEDDDDQGDIIVYAGHGGRDVKTGKQVAHQEPIGQNRALMLNYERGLPVRVIRGATPKSPHAPLNGYRYDGLYLVTAYWQERGRSGFYVWKFRLVKMGVAE